MLSIRRPLKRPRNPVQTVQKTGAAALGRCNVNSFPGRESDPISSWRPRRRVAFNPGYLVRRPTGCWNNQQRMLNLVAFIGDNQKKPAVRADVFRLRVGQRQGHPQNGSPTHRHAGENFFVPKVLGEIELLTEGGFKVQVQQD